MSNPESTAPEKSAPNPAPESPGKPDESSKKSGGWFWRIALVLTLLVAIAAAGAYWAFVMPIALNEKLFEEHKAAFEKPADFEANGIADYIEMGKHEVPEFSEIHPENLAFESVIANMAAAENLAAVAADLQLAKAALEANAPAIEAWDRAQSRAQSRSFIDFSQSLSGTPRTGTPAGIALRLGRIRLVATIDSRGEFLATVKAVCHAAATFRDHGLLVDAAISTIMVESLKSALAAHLRLMRGQLTTADLQALDAELAVLTKQLTPMETALVGEFLANRYAGENEINTNPKMQGMFPAAMHNAAARVYQEMISPLVARANLTNAEYAATPFDINAHLATTITGAEGFQVKLRGGMVAAPIYDGLFIEGRAAHTQIRLMRTALRIEAYLAQNKKLPDTLNHTIANPWPEQPFDFTDDWKPEALYHYEKIAGDNQQWGYGLGSVGNDGQWAGHPPAKHHSHDDVKFTLRIAPVKK